MKNTHREEKLKDRRAYRQTLIQKREDLDRKLNAVEGEIKALTTKAA